MESQIWYAGLDLNQRPLPPQGSALSAELPAPESPLLAADCPTFPRVETSDRGESPAELVPETVPDAPSLRDTFPENFDRLAQNFAKHVDRSGGRNACWPWTGTRQSKGYGSVGFKCADGKIRSFLAHRVAYMLATAQPLLPEIQVMHKCDNRPCCNPRHLFPGSQSDNMRDALNKGRMFIPGNPIHRGVVA